MDYFAPDLAISTKEEADEARYQFIIGILTWENYIDSAMNYTVYIFPLFSLIPVLSFCDELTGYYAYPYRFKNHKLSLVFAVLYRSIISALIPVLGFVIFFSIGNIFMIPSIEDIGGYSSILPDNFYHLHPYLFFLFMTFTIYFSIFFVFAMLGCGVALWTKKKHDVIIIPMLLYLCDAYIVGGAFGAYKYQIFGSVCAFNTIYSTAETFIPLIPFLIISLFLVIYGIFVRKSIR